jgi:AhpD family alkylhydroperoxidase
MLAVTQVNRCRYCSYAHTRAALKAGVTEEEIQELISGGLGSVPVREREAVLFAQHYAETEGHPDPKAWKRVVDTYGPDAARDIQSYVRVITFANLWGNTLDALWSRFAGRPAPDSSLGQELGVLLGSLLLIPASLVRRLLSRPR